MLPTPTLPAPQSLQRLLNHFWGCFTRPTFATFTALVTGLIGAPGARTVCGMLTGAGRAARWPHGRAHTFFSHRRWSPHHLGEATARLVADSLTAPGTDLVLAVDDTLVKRSGRSVFARARQHDGAAPGGLARGVCFVVTALSVELAGRTRRLALPTLSACWRPPRRARTSPYEPGGPATTARALQRARAATERARRGLDLRLAKEQALPLGHRLPGTDPKPALHQSLADCQQREADAQAAHTRALEQVLEQTGAATRTPPSKPEIGLALAWRQAVRMKDRTVHAVADSAFHTPALRALPANLTWTFRAASNLVLHAPPPPAPEGTPTRPGRPAHAGPRLGTPGDIAATARFSPTAVPGRTVADTACRWPRTLGPLPVRLVLIHHPAHTAGAYDVALVTTDTTSTAEQIADRYAHRWPIEVCFRDTRTHLGLEEAQNRTRAAVERTVPFQLLVYSLVALWYHRHGRPQEDVAAHRRARPWYTAKTDPAFGDMLAALQRDIIDHRISARFPDQRLRREIREIVLGGPGLAA